MSSRASWLSLVVVVLAALAVAGCAGARRLGAPSPPPPALPATTPPVALPPAATPAPSATTVERCPPSVRRRGLIAVAARGRVELLDLATCHLTVRRAMGATRVRFSPDGRWLAYVHPVRGNPGDVSVVPVGGGAPRSPLHGDIVAWSWARAGERLYGLTAGGSLVTASPRSRRRSERAPRGAPASVASFGLSPDGHRLAVNRSRCGRQSPNGELDTVNVRTGARVVALRQPGRYLTFAGWTADGRWLLYFPATQCSASLAADGWALDAVPAAGGTPVQAVGHMLLFDDLRSWCGQDLIAAAGPDRETETGSALVATAPPAWRERTIQPARRLSWTSPACAPSGRLLAAAAGPGNAPVTFGLEHRSIWLLRPGGGILRRLTRPPLRDLSDEAPRFSRDGRWIMFVRSQVVTVGRSASSRDTIELVPTSGIGSAVPIIDFTSDDISFYDHFGFPAEIDWHQPH